MLVLRCLVLALSAVALPAEHDRNVLGFLTPDSDAVLSTRHSLKPSSTRPASSSTTPTLATLSWTLTPTLRTDPPQPTQTVPALTIVPTPAEDHAANHSSKTWQIIGIAIIAVLFVATAVSCAMFFDRFWRFLRDVVSCSSRPLHPEEFITDCEKQGWDTRTLSPSPSEAESAHAIRPLPWNDTEALYRHPSQRNDRHPA